MAMAQAMHFPRSPEIKRIIKAAKDAGVEIGSIDIRADGVTISPPLNGNVGVSPYDKWKAQQRA